MQRSRAVTGIWNPGRCRRQRARCLSTKSPFASFISDVKVPESVEVEQTHWNVPKLSSLGDIEIPSTIPSKSTTSLFAALAAQRKERLQADPTPKATESNVTDTPEPTPAPSRSLLSRKSQRAPPKNNERRSGGVPLKQQADADATPKATESSVTDTPEPTPAPSRSVLFRKSQRVPPKDDEGRSDGGALKQQADTNLRPRRPSNVVPGSARVDYSARKERSRFAGPRRVVEPAIMKETATPPVLHASFNKTDLSELFSSPAVTPYITRPSVAQSHIDTRMQLLKERAGDYSRYLPIEADPTVLTVGSVGYAKLILARRKDVGLKSRHTAVELMKEAGAGINSTSVSATLS